MSDPPELDTLTMRAAAWVAQRPGVSSVLIGASRAEQVAQNVASPSVEFTPEQTDRLEQVTAPPSRPQPESLYPPTLRRSELHLHSTRPSGLGASNAAHAAGQAGSSG